MPLTGLEGKAFFTAEIERALDAPPHHVRLFLLYGPDEAESRGLAQRLERAMGPEAERVDLDGATLKSDPARLADEAASISLFGDKRHIRLTLSGDECMPAIEALLDGDAAGNPVVAIAGVLRPASALLKRALSDPAVMACISYALDAEKAAPLAAAMAREQGLRLDMDAARHLAHAAANDRALMAREVEKLALYLDAAPDRPATADMAALEAIGAGEGEALRQGDEQRRELQALEDGFEVSGNRVGGHGASPGMARSRTPSGRAKWLAGRR